MLMFAFGCGISLRAGPPFLTDDPAPVELHHWEGYVFSVGDRATDSNTVTAPAIELNYGVAPEMMLHLVAPVATVTDSGGGRAAGYGDTEFGVKYRFVRETESLPQVGVFPMVELATGDATRGLGNGRTWYRLPVWAQKSWGPWTTYGGGGMSFNPAPGQRDYGFGGWLLQRDLGKHWTLGAELFRQGADADGGRGFTVVNAGGYYNFTDDFNLLFSVGHTLAGERHAIFYLGLYWTWGPADVGKATRLKLAFPRDL